MKLTYFFAALGLSAAAATLPAAQPAAAQQAGDWTIGVGVHQVNPKSDNGTLAGAAAKVGSSTRPTFTAEYFLRDNLGVEILAALPFRHGVTVGGANAGTVKHLPPVVSLQYHFANSSAVTPFVGLGVNFTTFFGEDSPLGTLKLKNSWGLAGHVGADLRMTERTALRLDARWADIDTDVFLNGAPIGTAHIDPLVYGLSYVTRF